MEDPLILHPLLPLVLEAAAPEDCSASTQPSGSLLPRHWAQSSLESPMGSGSISCRLVCNKDNLPLNKQREAGTHTTNWDLG